MKSVAFLCTGNSARSVLGEAVLNRLGAPDVKAFSAGSKPTGAINPYAAALLKRLGYDISAMRSKSWDDLAAPDAETLDLVITVCDSAANETCPIWPGHPLTVHWGMPDPAAVQGNDADKQDAFKQTYEVLEHRIGKLLDLARDVDDLAPLREEISALGQIFPEEKAKANVE